MRAVRGDLPQLFGFDFPVDFELAQIAEQRPLLGRQPVGFALQRLQTFGRAARERLGARAIGRLTGRGDCRGGDGREDDGEAKRAEFHLSL